MYNEILPRIPTSLLLREIYSRSKKLRRIDGPAKSVALFLDLAERERECFAVAILNSKNRLLKKTILFEGTVDQAQVFPREIIKAVLDVNGNGVILAHNHPSGDPEPSPQDIQLTQKIKKICEELNIRVLDHVIVAENGHFSLKENGYL